MSDLKRNEALQWLDSFSANTTHGPSGLEVIRTLRSIIKQDSAFCPHFGNSLLYACLMNPTLTASRVFVEDILKDAALPFLKRADRYLHWSGSDMDLSAVNGFWRYTLEDIRHLAGLSPIRAHHWVAAFFLGDRNEAAISPLLGRNYLLSFDKLTIAAHQVELELGYHLLRSGVRHYDVLKPESFVNQRLLPYFDRCESESEAGAYPGQLAITLIEGELRVEPVDVWPPAIVADPGGNRDALQTCLSLRGYIALSQIREFERLINKPAVHEQELQEFLEDNPEFLKLVGNHTESLSQVQLWPQVCLSYEPERGGRPDFLLKDADGMWDVLEIKRAQVVLARGEPPRRRLADAVQEAIAQARSYRDMLADKQQIIWVKEKYGIDPIYPRLYVLIGRETSFMNQYEKKRLLGQIDDVRVLTYDDIVKIARHRWLTAP